MMQKGGHDIAFDTNCGHLRITSKGGGRDISPRLSPVKMLNWLEGFMAGVESTNSLKGTR